MVMTRSNPEASPRPSRAGAPDERHAGEPHPGVPVEPASPNPPEGDPRPSDVLRRPGDRVYRPGLDGLRAVAVVGVLLYHAGVHWMPGGLLGVDLFFVISGFLITSLLVSELQRTGRLALAAFYGRRARRLLPALAVVLAVTVGAIVLLQPGDLARFRGDLVASIGYVTNWWFIVQHQSYFVAAGRPSPFQHLWSLAIEEQFYLLWPLALLVLWKVRTRARSLAGARSGVAARALAWIGGFALIGAGASAGWMAYLALRQNLPYGADTSRVYFGTDTHASGLLLGVAAAAFLGAWAGPLWQRRPRLPTRIAFDVAGVAALAATGWAMLRTNEFSPALYRGGFLVFGAVAAVAVTAVSRPGGVLELVLGLKPLRWIGTRSYGLYLWHWPIFVYTRPQLDVPFIGAADIALRLTLTVGLAEASYRLVERPLRAAGLRAWTRRPLKEPEPLAADVPIPVPATPDPGATPTRAPGDAATRVPAKRYRSPERTTGRRQALAAMTIVVALFLGSGGVLSLGYAGYLIAGHPTLSTTWPALHLGPRHGAGTHLLPARAVTVTHGPAVAPSATATVTATVDAALTATETAIPAPAPPPPTPTPTVAPAPPPLPDGHAITAVGDSVMLGAVGDLTQALPGATVNAVEGRQASGAFTLLATLLRQGHLGSYVVLHIGTNGTIDPRALDSLLTSLAGRKVILLNLHVPRPWQDLNNAIISAAARNHPNVRLLDWAAAASGHPEWLWNDGIHLRPSGAAAYRDLILGALRQEQAT